MRYKIGCAGQFESRQGIQESDDVDEAIALCHNGPLGCEVYDTVDRVWIGPTCWEEIEDAEPRLQRKQETRAQRKQNVFHIMYDAQASSRVLRLGALYIAGTGTLDAVLEAYHTVATS